MHGECCQDNDGQSKKSGNSIQRGKSYHVLKQLLERGETLERIARGSPSVAVSFDEDSGGGRRSLRQGPTLQRGLSYGLLKGLLTSGKSLQEIACEGTDVDGEGEMEGSRDSRIVSLARVVSHGESHPPDGPLKEMFARDNSTGRSGVSVVTFDSIAEQLRLGSPSSGNPFQRGRSYNLLKGLLSNGKSLEQISKEVC